MVDAVWISDRLGLSVWTILSLARRGVLPAIRIGHRRKFEPRTIDDWIEAGGAAHREVCRVCLVRHGQEG